MIKLSLVCLILAALFVLTLVASYRLYRQKSEEIKRLNAELTKQKENTEKLARHVEKLIAIHNSEKKTEQLISEAKSDEEILSVINSIVAGNNSRVRK